jgi:hypothetical protein
MSCAKCQKAGQIISSNARFEELSLGTYGEMLLKVDCSSCQHIIRLAGDASLDPEIEIQLLRISQPCSEYQIAEESYSDFMLDIIPLMSSDSSQSTGVFVDENWIDIPRLRRWITCCVENHEGNCRNAPTWQRIESLGYLLLLDVELGCLVELSGAEARYVALSYVWGQVADTTETKLHNLEKFKQPGSLTAERLDINLPETIRDAIRLLSGLKERYLWVDRLCIVQDDTANKSANIAAMGAIYFNALFTIIAADGDDASYGLRGVGSGSKPRSFQQSILQLPDCPVLVQGDFQTELSSMWSTRGWTYQEQLLSRRLLIFTNGSVVWRCQQAEWREDITAEPEGVPRPVISDSSHTIVKHYRWPSLPLWRGFVVAYARRQLSFHSDTQAAFAGIQSLLARSFPGTFIHGLPEYFFDVALLWQPRRPLKRRVSEKASDDGQSLLPSWSWIGWQGSIDPKSWRAGHDYIERSENLSEETPSTWMVTPLNPWFQIWPSRDKRQRVASNIHLWRDPKIEPLPKGWSRHQEGTLAWFSHPLAERARFKYPIAFTALATSPSPHSSFPSHIELDTQVANFRFGGPIPGLDLQTVMSISLKTTDKAASNPWAGVLRLNILYSEDPPTDQSCELIAISTGRALNTSDESHWLEEWSVEERIQYNDSNEFYEFYNVLWIEREGEFATRKACGRVRKLAWETAPNLREETIQLH